MSSARTVACSFALAALLASLLGALVVADTVDVDLPQDRDGVRDGSRDGESTGRRERGRQREARRDGSGEVKEGATAGEEAKPDAKPAAPEKLTLERIFPEKGLFGPTASAPAFSVDGRYAAYLYRPYAERRHGPDLWIMDFESGEARRVTMVSTMSAFQEDARKVRDDRVKKAKAKRDADAKADRAAKPKQGADDARKRSDESAAAVVDPISGTWRGDATAEGTELIPPEGAEIAFELRRGDGDALSGVAKSAFGSIAIAEGVFESATGRVAGTLRFEQPPITARLEAKLADGALAGTIAVDGASGVVRFSTKRTAQPEAAPSRLDAQGAQGAGEKERAETAAEPAAGAKQAPVDAIVGFTARDLGDWVDDKDADDEKAPRYAGISGFTWSPVRSELIFTSAGELYHLDAAGDQIVRLTRTREDERGVDWLPDGSGYTYLRGDDLLRVVLRNDGSPPAAGPDGSLSPAAPASSGSPATIGLVEQINPRLPAGERMSGYRLSPDGRRLVLLATKGEGVREARQVTIVNYRDRFAQAQQVGRTMPDDPLPEIEESVYLYDLADQLSERAILKKVYSRKRSGPRDVLQLPEWAPDSSRVAFSVFDQATGRVEIMEASFERNPETTSDRNGGTRREKDPEGGADGAAAIRSADAGAASATDVDAAKKPPATTAAANTRAASDGAPPRSFAELAEPAPDPKPAHVVGDARSVYRFLHNGGPNTPRLIQPKYLADSRRMIFITELSGFRQLHVLDPTYEQLDALTRGRFEIYPIEMSKDHRRLFVLATKDDPAQQQVYRIDLESSSGAQGPVEDRRGELSGELVRLTTRDGFHDAAAVSDDGARVLATHADFGSLRDLYAIDLPKGTDVRLTDSHPETARALTQAQPEYFSYANRRGQEIHGHLFKPDDWTPYDQRPLLVYVYGGPLGQRKMASRGAFEAPSYFFAMYMAKVHGYVTCTIDPRGASGYGGLFEKSNYEQVGKPQVEDLVDGVKWMIANAAVDPKRVGIHGWSFGGFQTQMCLYTEPEVFALGIAGAGPTEWENYNAWYSTGTIGPSRAGQTDLAKFSLLPLAKNLKGRLLLVHGVEDSNVLYQDTIRVYRELLKAGKEALVDLFIDPTGNHGLGGDVKTLNRYRKYEDFLITHLGKGEASPMGPPAPPPEPSPEPRPEPTSAASQE